MADELQITTPDNRTVRHPLEGDSLTIGRAHGNDLSFPEDASLSRKHARLDRTEDGWTVSDLGSKNGTLLNRARITGRQSLRHGDSVTIGQLSISFVDTEQRPDGASVVFVPGSGPELHSSATVMTSLEGLLAEEPTSPGVNGAAVVEVGRTGRAIFEEPVVRALIRAGRELAGQQPIEELFRLILDLSIQAVGAERGVLMVYEGGELVPQAVHGEGFRISTTVRERVLNEKTSLLVRNVADEEALQGQHSITAQQIHSLMAVPLQTEDRVIGLIYVDSRYSVREFSPDDLNLLTVLANVAAIRIEHGLYQQLKQSEARRTADLEQAAVIQRGILPECAPRIDGLDVAGYNLPSRTVGGDYYDYIDYPDGRLAVVLGDVAGKGMSAALMMSSLQARVQLLAEEVMPLDELMQRLDKAVALHSPSNRFITLFAGLIDPVRGQMTYCNAGHNPPVLVRADGSVEMLETSGTVLGVLPELSYSSHETSLGAGDLLAIFSDGVTEAESPEEEEYGQDRLARLLVDRRGESAASVVGLVNESLERWCAGAPAADDVTLVIVRRIEHGR